MAAWLITGEEVVQPTRSLYKLALFQGTWMLLTNIVLFPIYHRKFLPTIWVVKSLTPCFLGINGYIWIYWPHCNGILIRCGSPAPADTILPTAGFYWRNTAVLVGLLYCLWSLSCYSGGVEYLQQSIRSAKPKIIILTLYQKMSLIPWYLCRAFFHCMEVVVSFHFIWSRNWNRLTVSVWACHH